MQSKQQRKIIFAITIFYTLFILYFLFFAFGRVGKADQIKGYTFIFYRTIFLGCQVYPTFYIRR